MIRSSRPWIAAAWALLLGAAPAIADGEPARAAEALPAAALETRSLSRATGWSLLASGVALDVSSFFLAEKADESYQEYQHGIDPTAVDRAYSRSVRYDRWASATLIAGQVAIASGLYLLLVKRPRGSEVGERVAEPEARVTLGGYGARGVALIVRF